MASAADSRQIVSANSDIEVEQLVSRLEAAIGNKAGGEAKALLAQMQSVHLGKVQAETRDALILETQGYLLGVEGSGHVEERAGDIPESIDPRTLSAGEFLGLVREGKLVAGRGVFKDAWSARAREAFFAGAAEVYGQHGQPAFLKVVCAAWLIVAGKMKLEEECSQRMGREAGGLLQSLWRLGRSGGIAPSKLNASLHRLDVAGLIRVKGWLLGVTERMKQMPETRIDSLKMQSALLLEKNRRTILLIATQKRDTAYPVEVARQMPKMLRDLNAFVDEMRQSEDEVVLEAAALLGGEPGGSRQGNINSIISRAIVSGQPATYIEEVIKAFRNGKTLREFYTGVDSLMTRGETEAAEILAKNKGTIISHALSSGQLDYVGKVVAAFDGDEGFLNFLATEIASLRERGDAEAAEALAKNKGSIVYRALDSGQLDYVGKVVAAFEGERGFLRLLDNEIASLREQGENEAAEALARNKGTIISHALSSGQLDYVGKVVAAFDGDEGFLNFLATEIASLRERGDAEAAEALAKNKDTIVNHALNSGDMDYMAKAIAAFKGEEGFLKLLYAEIANLRERNEAEAADALENHKGSIVSCALDSGQLDYVGKVVAAFEGEKGFLRLLDNEIASLREQGENEAAEALARNKGTIVNHALNSGDMDYMAKVIAAFKGEEGFLKLLDAEIANLRERNEAEAADALENHKGSIVSCALDSGQLDYVGKVVAAFEGEKGFLRLLDNEIASLREQGENEAAEALARNKGTIVNHALNSGDMDYMAKVIAAFKGEEGFLKLLDAEIANLRERNEAEVAEALVKNMGTIVNYALTSGRLDVAGAIAVWLKKRECMLAL